MAQVKSQRLQTLKKLATWSEDEAARLLGEVQAKLQAEQQQVDGLKHYYQEYLATIDQQKALSRHELINYRHFCTQLAQTIKQGEFRVAKIVDEVEDKKSRWLLCRNKRQVLQDLIDRCVQEEDQIAEQTLQKEIEDIWQSWR